MKVALGSDHAGFELKEAIKKHLEKEGYSILDLGPYSEERVDYPDYGAKVGRAVVSKDADLGIVCCGSAEGISMAANKIKGVRCGIGYNDEVSKLLREHNDANVIAFAGRFMSEEEVMPRVDLFLNTEFAGGRHQTRVEKLEELEK